MLNKKKMGRPPVDNPKSEKLTVRVDKETLAIVDDYCRRTGLSRANAVRAGVRGLRNQRTT